MASFLKLNWAVWLYLWLGFRFECRSIAYFLQLRPERAAPAMVVAGRRPTEVAFAKGELFKLRTALAMLALEFIRQLLVGKLPGQWRVNLQDWLGYLL